MLKLSVADLNLNIDGDINQFFIDRTEKYMSNFTGESDISIHFEYCSKIERPDGKIINQFGRSTNYYDLDGNYGYYLASPEDELIYLSTVFKKNHIFIKMYDYDNNPNMDFSYPLLNTTDRAIRLPLLNYDRLVLHASAIEYQNNGIAFSAPSGTGKSTQTALWMENYPTTMINDDSPILKIEDNMTYIYGSPWAGSTGISSSIKVPLRGIIFLEQAPVNSIEKISSPLALMKIRTEISNPNERTYMLKTLDLLDKLLTNTECYLLKCTPDKRASDLAKETLFK